MQGRCGHGPVECREAATEVAIHLSGSGADAAARLELRPLVGRVVSKCGGRRYPFEAGRQLA